MVFYTKGIDSKTSTCYNFFVSAESSSFIVLKEICWSHGSVGRTYWPMYITTSSLPGSASGSTKFRGLPHLPKGRIGRPFGIERCRPVLPLPQHFRECRYSWSHGSVGSTYWPMYITTSSLPGSASGSTNFRGLPHLPPEESVDRPVIKSPSGSPN